MEKKTFIPNWYLNNKNILRNKKLKMCIMVVLLVNIFILSLILNISNEINTLEKQSPIENIKSSSNSKVESVKQDISTIECYKKLSDFLEKNNMIYKNIVITKGSLDIDIEVKSYEEYVYVIKCIESEYSIKKLTETIKDGDNFNFKVIVGV